MRGGLRCETQQYSIYSKALSLVEGICWMIFSNLESKHNNRNVPFFLLFTSYDSLIALWLDLI